MIHESNGLVDGGAVDGDMLIKNSKMDRHTRDSKRVVTNERWQFCRPQIQANSGVSIGLRE